MRRSTSFIAPQDDVRLQKRPPARAARRTRPSGPALLGEASCTFDVAIICDLGVHRQPCPQSREPGWRCCMSASITNGNGPEMDGKSCAVVNTNTGANCVSALGTPIVRSRCVNMSNNTHTHTRWWWWQTIHICFPVVVHLHALCARGTTWVAWTLAMTGARPSLGGCSPRPPLHLPPPLPPHRAAPTATRYVGRSNTQLLLLRMSHITKQTALFRPGWEQIRLYWPQGWRVCTALGAAAPGQCPF